VTTRRRIASIVLIAVVVVAGSRLLKARDQIVPLTIVYRVDPEVTRVEAELRPAAGGDPVARFAAEVQGDAPEQKTRLRPGDYEATITLTVAGGAERTATRRITAARDVRVTLDLRSHR
jgi:hypothetical protein